MPMTQTRTLYQIDELPTEKAKAAARQWFTDVVMAGDTNYADTVLEEADDFAALMGITIDTERNGSPRILWSGFYTQGDGACFTGGYVFKAGALAALKEEAPQDAKLLQIAADLFTLQQDNAFALRAEISHRDRYTHSGSVDIHVTLGEDGDVTPETERALADVLRRYMDWIWEQLREAYEAETSDEAVNETLQINGYWFDETGKHVAV
ncbi:hypothetical protein KIKIMORA_05040 [Brevundimonas phage vB_BpoS-Kikimora]|uniref:Antitoxin of toxin-antitoxin stability system n=1 Tax=Brevundimonas phage vB_BpoS-Kikimora TaxID=2948601 RepID=A0A9E7MTS6_9CAUD|nr:hypothetical protein KIKIMORA_05040 [Brevundimonas phage vB_BpoS-Kikimora]